ncbi:2-C-methyl-D-erythritol 4-phosphate cytidylyltransferase [Actinotalea sp.]|uniref:2-C-methyl-D-erythritol 4-phosphate cytidylyltransferase n=1 Tax=Actinotalea sp. TaxID=1872145 RepID=UPI00356A4A2B
MRVVAILTSAGSGTRLGAVGPKALVPLAGVPLVVRAARALVACGRLSRLVVTAGAEHVEAMRAALATADPPVDAVVVLGGATRQASVAAGLELLLQEGSGPTVVLVHDAARPLVPTAVVQRVIDAVESGHEAVVPGLPVTDTVKLVDLPPADATVQDDGARRVLGTPDRRALRAVQTPQGFTLDVLGRAHRAGAARAGDERTAATDDAALAEAIGVDVWVVAGHEDALKITTPRDLVLAELLLAGAGAPSSADTAVGSAR